MKYFLCKGFMCLAALLAIVAIWPAQSYAADPYRYEILSVNSEVGTNACNVDCVIHGEKAVITFRVVNTTTNQNVFLSGATADPQLTHGRLFLHVGWSTTDYTNKDSNTNIIDLTTGKPFARGAAMPVPINALNFDTSKDPWVVPNGDGTYTVSSPFLLPVPSAASGSGTVIMEGHPTGFDSAKGLSQNKWND